MSTDEQHLYSKVDRSSFSNPLEAISTNLKLNWDIDFDKKCIAGSAEHTIKVTSAGATHVDFDTRDLKLNGDVFINHSIAKVTVAEKHEILGTKLSVEIPQNLRELGSQFKVTFNYSTSTDASAMQWLDAAATKGKKHPYLFTQSQAIHARSMFPCQDSPGVKCKYTARVTAPKWCTVLMSALADNGSEDDSFSDVPAAPADKNVFIWTQPTPVSAYLVALAAGNLASKDISHRVRVWAEPEVVEEAHFEFSETEDFVKVAEDLTGCAYVWHRYDVLCLPPSFPYGGMENPCLTFATPTLLAGDKSLADVIAHEIAHSWTGNLVTNQTWDHFWLNEGWTVWLERKIVSKVRNNAEAGKLSSQIGWKHLKDDMKLVAPEHTRLVWDLNPGEDPDNAYSSVPYEKGCNLLLWLEELVGTDLFEGFVKSYIETFKFDTITSGQFRDHFVSYFEGLANAESESNAAAAADADPTPSKGGKNNKKNKAKSQKEVAKSQSPTKNVSSAAANALEKVKQLDWNKIYYSEGLPDNVVSYKNSLSTAAEALAHEWIHVAESKNFSAAPKNGGEEALKGWTTPQKNLFLEVFLNHAKKTADVHPADIFPSEFLQLMDRTLHFTESKNSEIMLRWQTLCIESECEWIIPSVVSFITSQGRMKFVRPLYRQLRNSAMGKQIAIDTFEKNKNIYHPIARKMVGVDLEKAQKADEQEEAKEAIRAQHQAEQQAAAAAPPAAPLATPTQTPAKSAPSSAYALNTPPPTAMPMSDVKAGDVTPPPMASPQQGHFYTPDAAPAVDKNSTPASIATPPAAFPKLDGETKKESKSAASDVKTTKSPEAKKAEEKEKKTAASSSTKPPVHPETQTTAASAAVPAVKKEKTKGHVRVPTEDYDAVVDPRTSNVDFLHSILGRTLVLLGLAGTLFGAYYYRNKWWHRVFKK